MTDSAEHALRAEIERLRLNGVRVAEAELLVRSERDTLRAELQRLADRFRCEPIEAVTVALTYATTTDCVLNLLQVERDQLTQQLEQWKWEAEQQKQLKLDYVQQLEQAVRLIIQSKDRIGHGFECAHPEGKCDCIESEFDQFLSSPAIAPIVAKRGSNRRRRYDRHG